MMRAFLALAALLSASLLSACSGGTIQATLVDGIEGKPLANVQVVARAQQEVAFSCQTVEGTTNDKGEVTLQGPCLSASSYSIAPKDSALWFTSGNIVDKGSSGTTRIEALFAPTGSGAYVLHDGALTPLSTHGDVKRATVLDSEEVVEFPSRIPAEDDIPRIGDDAWLVLTGTDNAGSARLVPLVKSEPRRLMHEGDMMTMQDWWYLGIRFASDRDFTRQAAMVDERTVTRHEDGDRAVLLLPQSALPGGRYALRTAGSGRITVIDFGVASASE